MKVMNFSQMWTKNSVGDFEIESPKSLWIEKNYVYLPQYHIALYFETIRKSRFGFKYRRKERNAADEMSFEE